MSDYESHIFIFSLHKSAEPLSDGSVKKNNARILIEHIINNSQVTQADLEGVYNIFYHVEPMRLIGSGIKRSMDKRSLLFKIPNMREEYHSVPVSKFKKLNFSNLDQIPKINDNDDLVSIIDREEIDYVPSTISIRSDKKKKIIFHFLDGRFNNALYYGIANPPKDITSDYYSKNKEQGGALEYVFTKVPIKYGEVLHGKDYFSIGELKKVLANNPNMLEINISNDKFSLYDFKNILGFIENYKSTLFFINFALDEKFLYRLRPYLLHINKTTQNAIFFLNKRMLITSFNTHTSDLIPLIRFQKKDLGFFIKERHAVRLFENNQIMVKNDKGSKLTRISALVEELNKTLNEENKIDFLSTQLRDVNINSLIDSSILSNIYDAVYFAPIEIREELAQQITSHARGMHTTEALLFSLILSALARDYWQSAKLKEQLEKIRQDVYTYAAGTNELIENVCSHSASDGFLHFRLHKTGIDKTIDQELNSIEARKELGEKFLCYNNKTLKDKEKISSEFRFHLEIEVMDFGQCSICETFKERKLKNPNARIDFAGFFDESRMSDEHFAYATKPQSVIYHYGIRLFVKSVINNNGYFIAQSSGKGNNNFNSRSVSGLHNATNSGFKRVLFLNSYEMDTEKRRQTEFVWTRKADAEKDARSRVQSNRSLVVNQTYRQFFCGSIFSFLLPIGYVASDDGSNIMPKDNEIYDLRPINRHHKVLSVGGNTIRKTREFWKQYYDSNYNNLVKEREIDVWTEEFNLELDDATRLNHDEGKRTNFIFKIEMDDLLFENTELFCKVLMGVIYKRHDKRDANDDSLDLYTLVWKDEESEFSKQQIKKFIRLFSIFYLKGKRDAMSHVQIAILSKYGDRLNVNFMLAGKSINTLYNSAKLFSYYNLNLESSANYLSLLAAIKNENPGVEDFSDNCPTSLFPFDLILDKDGNETANHESLFGISVKNVLEKNLQREDYGIKLKDVYFRVKRRQDGALLVRDYYAIDLLFNNLSKIYKFAYLIAGDIIKDIDCANKTIKNLVLIGHRQYISILVQQVTHIIKKHYSESSDIKINSVTAGLISYAAKNGITEPVLEMSYDLTKTLQQIAVGDKNERIHLVLIEPISISFDTFQLLENLARKEFDGYQVEVFKRLSLIVYQNQLQPTDRAKSYFCIKNEYVDDSYDFENPLNERLFVKIDGETSKLNKIFELMGRVPNNVRDDKKEARKIEALKACITNAHIVKNENHHLFYIDNEKYFNKQKNDIIDELKERRKDIQKINEQSENEYIFNLIVAPQHDSNSEFVKAVADNVFAHNLKFVYFPLGSVHRENIRTQLSYITQDIKKLNNKFRRISINAYYVDDTINSGKSIAQAKLLMEMLFDEAFDTAEIDTKECKFNLFSGIFILVNRRALNNLKQFIAEDKHTKSIKNKTDRIYSYLNLKAQVNKIEKFKCPTCVVLEKYKTMARQSATNLSNRLWKKCINKHSLKTPLEYKDWIEGRLEKARVQRDDNKNIVVNDPNSMDGYLRWYYQEKYLYNQLESLQNDTEDLGAFMIDHVLANRNLLRVKSIHNAVARLEDIFPKLKDEQRDEINFKTRLILIQLLNEECGLTDENLKCSGDELNRIIITKTEKLISYIKVISRPPMSAYHHIGQAILTIMIELIESAINESICINSEYPFGRTDYEPHFKGVLRLIRVEKDESYTIPYLTQYQLFEIMFKSLSSLGSTYVINQYRVAKFFAYMSGIDKEYNRQKKEGTLYSRLNPLVYFDPKKENGLMSQYCRNVKWMLEVRDDPRLYKIYEENLSEMIDRSRSENKADFKDTLLKALYVENMQHLYKKASNKDYLPKPGEETYCKNLYNELHSLVENPNCKGKKYDITDLLKPIKDVILMNADIEKFAVSASSKNTFKHLELVKASAAEVSNAIFAATDEWIFNTFFIKQQEKKFIGLIKIPFYEKNYALSENAESGIFLQEEEEQFIYFYLEFKQDSKLVCALKGIRNILFLRETFEKVFVKYAPLIFLKLTKGRNKLVVVKEIYAWVTQHSERHSSLLKDFSLKFLRLEKEQLQLAKTEYESALKYVKSLFDELIDMDKASFGTDAPCKAFDELEPKVSSDPQEAAAHFTDSMNDYYIKLDDFIRQVNGIVTDVAYGWSATDCITNGCKNMLGRVDVFFTNAHRLELANLLKKAASLGVDPKISISRQNDAMSNKYEIVISISCDCCDIVCTKYEKFKTQVKNEGKSPSNKEIAKYRRLYLKVDPEEGAYDNAFIEFKENQKWVAKIYTFIMSEFN